MGDGLTFRILHALVKPTFGGITVNILSIIAKPGHDKK